MTQTYDAIVLGVGGFGSATLMHLARRGLKVLGIDRFGIAHDRGSSHGETRIIRKAYFEHPDYVPLLQRSYELWRELEAASGSSLYNECGLFLAGPPEGEVVSGTREAARTHSLMLDDVPLDEARRRFPQFVFPDGDDIVFEHQAGVLSVESCVLAHALQAEAAGAECCVETVVGWETGDNAVCVRTADNEYAAGALVVAAGAWSGQLLNELGLPLTVLRKLLFWYRTQAVDWDNSSPFFFDQPAGQFYGFPACPEQSDANIRAVKLAEHTGGETITDPTNVDRELRPVDSLATNAFVTRTLRHVDPHPLRHAVCMYSMTPDGHFIIDRHPEQPNVVLAAGFSGHGFKFTPVIGEALADLVIDGEPSLPIDFLRLSRFDVA